MCVRNVCLVQSDYLDCVNLLSIRHLMFVFVCSVCLYASLTVCFSASVFMPVWLSVRLSVHPLIGVLDMLRCGLGPC